MRRFVSIILPLILFVAAGVLGGCDMFSPAVEPPAPSSVSAEAGDQAVTLSWEAPSIEGVEGYNVYRSDSSFDNAGDMQPVDGGSQVQAVSFADSSVSNGTTYYYRVTVVDTDGNESKGSTEVSATPFPDPPDWP